VEFEWDASKAALNFVQAWRQLWGGNDNIRRSLETLIPDPVHSAEELRFVSIGLSEADRVLVVVYTERDQRIRIISAREPNPVERRQYESKVQF
jgi:uncharacterized DUF497 family protein